ncbi:hypothetical protein GCM10011316_05620 [Roseibium aquae]|uniref:Uncharacterized protein n=1 Tax=Roseibium aquae TaxID=1323746 RepID=A0A916WWP3_9HYPH|nr:hypothetical protein [Roseibium aquae]GGB36342.1 hypothetical protein GCM10011316_05620 [Roseibium aquae]
MRQSVFAAGLAVAVMTVPTFVFAGGNVRSCYEQVVVPAAYQTVQKTVLVKPATQRVVHTEPVYGYRTRQVVVQPERITYRTVAPVYQTRHDRVLVRPASVGWEYQMRKGRKVLCKVEHPAVYQTVARTVLVKPGGKVAVRQAAIYGTVQEKVVIHPAGRHVVTEPAIYKTVHQKVKVSEARTAWRPVSARCR